MNILAMLLHKVNSIPCCGLNDGASKVPTMGKKRKELEPWQIEDAKRLLAQTGQLSLETYPPTVSVVGCGDIGTDLVNKLKGVAGKVLDAEQMRPIVGTGSSTGVGPRLRSIRNALKREGDSLDNYIRTKKADDGTTRWEILDTTAKSA